MKLSRDAVIAEAKLTKYLLVWRDADDKSKFLEQAGYTLENWKQLEADLRNQILLLEAVPSDEPNWFGDVYEQHSGQFLTTNRRMRVPDLFRRILVNGKSEVLAIA